MTPTTVFVSFFVQLACAILKGRAVKSRCKNA